MTDEEDKKSRLYIEFEDLGSALFDMKIENVTPNQMAVLAQFFQFQAQTYWVRQQQMAEMNRIQVPSPPDIQVARR